MLSITACGGILFRIEGNRIAVLLIKRRGYWDIPKGKLELSETIPFAAVREVSEEVGIPTPMIVKDLGTTEHQYIQDGVDYHKTTHWYAMVTSAKDYHPQFEEEIEAVTWMFWPDARVAVEFRNLEEVLDRFNEWIKSTRQLASDEVV